MTPVATPILEQRKVRSSDQTKGSEFGVPRNKADLSTKQTEQFYPSDRVIDDLTATVYHRARSVSQDGHDFLDKALGCA